MTAQAFFAPTTTGEVLDLLALHGEQAVIVNGGTDIVERLNSGAIRPAAIVYIREVKELDYIREQDGYLAIGGICTYRSMQEAPLCQGFTGLQEALAEIGSPPIRVVATPAGNIGTAASGADCNVVLMALGASVVLSSAREERVVHVDELFSGPAKTCRRANELIREIRLPLAVGASAFIKLAKRKAQDIAQISTCVCLKQDANGKCAAVRIALGAVASRVVRVPSMEKLVEGKTLEEALVAIKGFVPGEISLRNPKNRAYKEAVLGVIVSRALKKAYAETVRSS